jgi:hypothetical protein
MMLTQAIRTAFERYTGPAAAYCVLYGDHIFHDYYDYIEFQLRCEYNEIPIIRLDTQFSCNRRIQYESCLVLPFSSL